MGDESVAVMAREKDGYYGPIGEPTPVPLSDISAYTYEQRAQHYNNQYGGSQAPSVSIQTKLAYESARMAAKTEMLNEQHAMLLAICKKLGIEVG